MEAAVAPEPAAKRTAVAVVPEAVVEAEAVPVEVSPELIETPAAPKRPRRRKAAPAAEAAEGEVSAPVEAKSAPSVEAAAEAPEKPKRPRRRKAAEPAPDAVEAASAPEPAVAVPVVEKPVAAPAQTASVNAGDGDAEDGESPRRGWWQRTFGA